MASNARIEASLVSVGSSMKNEQLCMIARQKWTGKGRQILVWDQQRQVWSFRRKILGQVLYTPGFKRRNRWCLQRIQEKEQVGIFLELLRTGGRIEKNWRIQFKEPTWNANEESRKRGLMRWAKGFPGKNAFQRKILGLLEVERFKFSVADAVNLSIKFGKLEKL